MGFARGLAVALCRGHQKATGSKTCKGGHPQERHRLLPAVVLRCFSNLSYILIVYLFGKSAHASAKGSHQTTDISLLALPEFVRDLVHRNGNPTELVSYYILLTRGYLLCRVGRGSNVFAYGFLYGLHAFGNSLAHIRLEVSIDGCLPYGTGWNLRACVIASAIRTDVLFSHGYLL
ncbi:hypothetical protein ATY81_25450 [Rhizobium sp. R72]|nr:hypothetical protein ATY81_25450 [Rhizobium sp. R72]OWW00532.1 hypothetical protein ATY80_25450 [Rhizobium sp. R711]